jgi:hypothetical protein
MKDFTKDLEKYFKETSKEQLLKDWEKSKEFDRIGPTVDEYLKAKEIINDYEKERKRLNDLSLEAFKKDLQLYFDNNLIDGKFKLKSFQLNTGYLGNGEIIPTDPCMEENYEGGNNEDIQKICEKHQVDYKIVYWCYHK